MNREKLQAKMRAKDIVKYYPIALSTVWLYAKQRKLTPYKISSKVTVFDTEEVCRLFGDRF
ncbi:hypothetical protein CP986_01695 [Arcobacter aquimarinus]|uniref:DNA-binding protein n=1 Tax=Arcobacter aquimarinus TaxID=1315211 RepID=A0AAE7E1G8_9BACT|nr:hypothetical protein AAQM_1869 [Arcobacter aquimarinus]RXI36572.1 hypothetical protein CP986_01695 [Arcobacter aquimarinus]